MMRPSQLFLTVISVVSYGHLGCLSSSLRLFDKSTWEFQRRHPRVFWQLSCCFFCNKLIISALSKTLYFCEKPAQRWPQLREIDSQALFFVSFSNNFLLSWRLILFLALLFFVCLPSRLFASLFACLSFACLPVCLLPVCRVLYAAAVQLPLPSPAFVPAFSPPPL